MSTKIASTTAPTAKKPAHGMSMAGTVDQARGLVSAGGGRRITPT